jgi:hypothetical protein
MVAFILPFLVAVEVGVLVETIDGLAACFALSAKLVQIAPARAGPASLVDFSMIARCFSSSLAGILTISSGMGSFN